MVAPRVARPLTTLTAGLFAVSTCLGCADEPGSNPVAAAAAPGDCGPGAADVAAAGDDADSGNASGLSPCQQACDRVVDCGVADCKGWSWAGAGELWHVCDKSCTPAIASAVLAAEQCAAVRTEFATHDANFAQRCRSNPCQLACEKLSGCIVQECAKVAQTATPSLLAGCLQNCNPQTSGWVLGADSCKALTDAIAANDPAFAGNCNGTPPKKCADAAACKAYASKATGCIKAHCKGNTDAWHAGIEAVVRDYCQGAPDCPDPAAVAWVNNPAVTCETKGMDQLGPAPPFTALCDGSVPITPTDAKSACSKVLACPGLEGAGSVDKCMVLFAIRPDAAQRIKCLNATSACKQVYACLEGL